MSGTLRELKDKASRLTAAGKLPAALDAWRKVAAASPDDIPAQQKVAELLVKLGKKADAAQVYEDVARRYAEKGLFFKASAVCRLLVGLEPAHQRTQELIASLYSRSKAQPALKLAAPAVRVPTGAQLPSIPLFSTLAYDELKEVLSTAMDVRTLVKGEVVVAEGSPGDSMFALAEGAAGIYRGWGTSQQRRVDGLAPGDIFGEIALVSGSRRLATVVADRVAVVLEFRREAMRQVIARHPSVEQSLDRFCRDRLLANALRASPILRELPDADKDALAAAFQLCDFPDGQPIVTRGQPADSVHMLLRGVCTAAHESGERYPDMREGDLFGELSVLTGRPATATVTASGPVLTLRLPANEFKARVLKHPGATSAVKKLAQARMARTLLLDARKARKGTRDGRV